MYPRQVKTVEAKKVQYCVKKAFIKYLIGYILDINFYFKNLNV